MTKFLSLSYWVPYSSLGKTTKGLGIKNCFYFVKFDMKYS